MVVLYTELKPEGVRIAAGPLQQHGDFEAINTEATVAEPRPEIPPGSQHTALYVFIFINITLQQCKLLTLRGSAATSVATIT